jgi:pSer/pThr/pTyr-binding forkhead associated (FHA) protein
MLIPLSGTPVTVGRRSDNDVVIDESTVSRRHALVMETPTGFVARDLSTTNGTFVNRDNIGLGERPLKHGDEIRLGGSQVKLIFREEGSNTVTIKAQSSATGPIGIADVEPSVAARRDLEKTIVGKDAELLALLRARKGSVVSMEDIQRRVWPEVPGGRAVHVIIDDSIQRLRAHIEDDPRNPRRLLTVGEVGFLLV